MRPVTPRLLIVASTLCSLLCAGCIVPPPQTVAVAEAPPPNCREYSAQIMVAGQPQTAYGWACQQPDGSWQITQQVAGGPPQVYVVPANPTYPPYYPYWAYDPFWGPQLAITGTFVFGGHFGFHHHGFAHGRGFHRR